MLNDFVARLAYNLTGPGGLLLDLTSLRALRNIPDQVEAIEKALGYLFDPTRSDGAGHLAHSDGWGLGDCIRRVVEIAAGAPLEPAAVPPAQGDLFTGGAS